MAKDITIKAYSNAGVFIKALTDATFGSFVKSINGGLGPMTFSLARKLDNFNSAGDVSIGNRIDVWVFDEDTGSAGTLLYSGFIEQHNPQIDGGDERVEVICLGVVNRLNLDILKSSANTTLYTDSSAGLDTGSPSNAAAVETVVKKGIDLFNANNVGVPLAYDTAGGSPSIQTTGATISYDFVSQTYLDFLKKCLEAAPANWYFFIDAHNLVNFKAPPASATHKFVLGKNIKLLKVEKGVDSVKNILLLFDGASTYKQYKDDTSISQYGRRVKILTDPNLGDTTTMDAVGNAFIAENKDPRVRVTLQIIDNNEDALAGYDIESISPGDTCLVSGLAASDLLTSNMAIKEVQYNLKSATLIIETRPEFDINSFIVKLRKDVDQQAQAALPASYT